MKKIFCFGLIGILSFGATSFAKAAPISHPIPASNVQGRQITVQSKVKVSTKEVKDSQEAYKINLQIPVLEKVQDTEIQTAINTFIEKDALAFAQDIKNQALKFAENSKKQGWKVRSYDVSTSYKVTYNENNIISIACTYYSYTLGAHGNSEIKTLNFDLTTGKQLALKNLLNKNENYISVINEEIQKQIKLDPSKYFSEKNQGFITIRSDQPFGIESDNVILYFNPYEIAPYSTGTSQFKIPFSLFKEGVKTGFEVKADSVKVVPELISEKSEALTSDIKIPVLKDLKNEKIQSEINKTFEKRALELKKQMTTEGKDALKDAKNYGYEAKPYSLLVDYDISYNEKNIISITIIYYQYTGGAHGNTLTETSNINLKTGEKIVLKDFFKEGVDYKKIITNEVKKQMATEDKFYPNASIALDSISDNQSFYITEDGIVIYYQPYEIAPYAAGTPEFKIPFSVLKDSLKPHVAH